MGWLKALDWRDAFATKPFQDASLYDTFPDLSPTRCEEALHLILRNGKTYAGADAFREIFLRMPATIPLGVLFALPPIRQVARLVYPVIARNRSWLSTTCGLKRPEK